MKRERIVEFVGGSEEEIAFLRLLLRKAAIHLTDKWRLRREDDSHVDVLVIHDISEAGSTAPAGGDGAPRRVRLIDSVFGAAGMETAPWPLPLDQIIRMLNLSAAAGTPQPVSNEPVIQQNVYDDLFEPSASAIWKTFDDLGAPAPLLDLGSDWAPPTRPQESALTLEAEMLFRREPSPDHKESLAAFRLDDSVGVEATDGKTARGGSRKDLREPARIMTGKLYTLSEIEANQQHSLVGYLTGRWLPSPSSIEVSHHTLTLDPRNRQFYAKGALCLLEDCCKQILRRGDWRGLTADEFAVIKDQIKPRPYTELLWLCCYLDDTIAPGPEFAANARFRLFESVDLKDSYAGAARVVQELEKGTTLAAAAAAAGVPIAVTQKIAAAFDAVGILIPD